MGRTRPVLPRSWSHVADALFRTSTARLVHPRRTEAIPPVGVPYPGHPERDLHRGIENTSGPLGQGHTFAAGAAVAEKFLAAKLGKEVMQHKIYAYISDGGIEEEISQGTGRIAGTLGLSNLIMFYDSNDIQLSTETKVVMKEDTAAKYKAWGWNVLTCNGNDADEIRAALKEAQKEDRTPHPDYR